jgi:DNA-binding transcriptional regulator YiaG
MDLPYIVSLGDGRYLAINLHAAWLKADRSGQPLLLPPAVRALDRLRAVFTTQQQLTPGFIVSLRHAIGATQAQFGRMLGVSKMTVSRWECGRIRPRMAMSHAIRKLQASIRRRGIIIDGQRHTADSSPAKTHAA